MAVVDHMSKGFRHPSTKAALGGWDLLGTASLNSSHGKEIEAGLVNKSILIGEEGSCVGEKG